MIAGNFLLVGCLFYKKTWPAYGVVVMAYFN